MKKNNRNLAIADGAPVPAAATVQSGNGHSGPLHSPDLVAILESLQRLRDGDFSVRLPGSWVGLSGKVADTFNDIASANQHMAHELNRVGQVVGKKGET